MGDYVMPEKRIEPHLITLESAIRDSIGTTLIHEGNLISIGGLNIWGVEKLRELYETYTRAEKDEGVTPRTITKLLRSISPDFYGLENVSIETPHNNCCEFHRRRHEEEHVKDGKAELIVKPDGWRYQGIGIGETEEHALTCLLIPEGTISLPLFDTPDFFTDEYDDKKMDPNTFRRRLKALGKTKEALSQATDLLEKIVSIADAYGTLPFIQIRHHPTYTGSFERFDIKNLRGLPFSLRLESKRITSADEITNYGRAIIGILEYLDSINYSGSIKKINCIETRIKYYKSVKDFSIISQAEPLFRAYHDLFEKYLDAGHKSGADM